MGFETVVCVRLEDAKAETTQAPAAKTATGDPKNTAQDAGSVPEVHADQLWASVVDQRSSREQLAAVQQAVLAYGPLDRQTQKDTTEEVASPRTGPLPEICVVEQESVAASPNHEEAAVASSPTAEELPSEPSSHENPWSVIPNPPGPAAPVSEKREIQASPKVESQSLAEKAGAHSRPQPKSQMRNRQWWFNMAWNLACAAAMVALAFLVNLWLFRDAGSPQTEESSVMQDVQDARQGGIHLREAQQVTHTQPVGPVARIVDLLPSETPSRQTVEEAAYTGPLTEGDFASPTVHQARHQESTFSAGAIK